MIINDSWFTINESVLTPLAKSVFTPSGLSLGMSAEDVAIQKKIHGSGTAAVIISNEEMENIIKIVTSFEESGLVIKWISEGIQNKTK